MSWAIENATSADIDELMTWFSDARSVDLWGGPRFRYPFTRSTFRSDCRLQEYSAYCLRESNGDFVAFGQLGSRYERSHLVRIVARPDMRGQGVGKRLVMKLIEIVKREQETPECGLFVYKKNEAAIHCYLSLGFKMHEYPDGAPMREQCFYLTRAV